MIKCNSHVSSGRYHNALAQIFGPSLLKKITSQEYELQLKNLLKQSNLYDPLKPWSLLDGLSDTYNYLKKFYRCEYIYKNEIANQLLLKYHNDNSATMLKEVNSHSCIADVIIINGSTVAYEIKTELDNFERLPNQVASFSKIYDQLNVVTHYKAIPSLEALLPKNVGIMYLDDKGIIKSYKPAESNVELFDPTVSSLTLRQSELMIAHNKYEGPMPKMGTALIHRYCINWYQKLDLTISRKIFAESLKARRPSDHQFETMMQCPPSLRSLMLGVNFSKKNCNDIKEKILTLV